MRRARFAIVLMLLAPPLNSANAQALETPIQNFEDIARQLNLAGSVSEQSLPPQKLVKIAILDNGFRGFSAALGRTLPASTVYHAGPIDPPQPEEDHGTAMAQIVTSVMTNGGRSQRVPFELHLFSAYGYSNLVAAINSVVIGRFDVVLYSQVWEYGGNGDGRGFINAQISRATDAGVLWINAAGNFAQSTFRTAIRRISDDWAALPSPNHGVRIRCRPQKVEKCRLRLVLSWNDFHDDIEVGSEKDLDLILFDDAGKIVQSSGLVQKNADADQAGTSKYPREILVTEVPSGMYEARVKIRSTNFAERDRLTLTASGDFIQLIDRTTGETLLNPADHPRAITVGASDSELSSSSRVLHKPELVFPSLIELRDGARYKGSSNSAAVAAAAAALLRARTPTLTREEFLARIRVTDSRRR